MGGVFDAVLEGGGDSFEAGGDVACDSLKLGGALSLGGGEVEQVAAHLVHLGFEGLVLFLVSDNADEYPGNEADKDQAQDYDGDCEDHWYSPVITGNG